MKYLSADLLPKVFHGLIYEWEAQNILTGSISYDI
jgi:hypothetical protein